MPIHTYDRYIKTALTYVMRVVYIQVALCFVYIPILIYWGLPISIMSIVGNIVFTPFLFLFIGISFFIFITELLFIPNGLLCSTLNILSDYWLKTLSLGSPNWLIGFANPGIPYLALYAVIGTLSIWASRRLPVIWRTAALFVLLLMCTGALKVCTPIPTHHTLVYQRTTWTITNTNNQLTLIIPRVGLRQKNFASWVTHTLRKELYKAFGHPYIYKVILINPTPHTVEILRANKELIGYQELVLIKK